MLILNGTLKDIEKYGFRKHKGDGDTVVSKWTREWIEADTVDGYSIGGSGWEFYPIMKFSLLLDGKWQLSFNCKLNKHWSDFPDRIVHDTLYDMIIAGLLVKEDN